MKTKNFETNRLLTQPSRKPYIEQYFEAGHKIGKPSPLFAKIEATRLEELKQKYGGQQEVTVPAQQYKSAADIEKAIQLQGEKVRTLKANKTEKPLLDPEIATLLKLKKDLQTFLDNEKKTAPPTAQSTDTTQKVKDLEDKITKQGEKVRTLKAKKTEKPILDPEIATLLKLKKDLQTFLDNEKKTAAPTAQSTDPTQKIKDLEDKITKQGEKVRTLKASGDKTVWQPEVDVLLKLKNELAALSGTSAQPAPTGKNKKKK